MSKRLQVVVTEDQLKRYEDTALALGLTLSAWIRQTLGAAERELSIGDVDAQLAAIRSAYAHSFPAPDVAGMLAEIETGYLESPLS